MSMSINLYYFYTLFSQQYGVDFETKFKIRINECLFEALQVPLFRNHTVEYSGVFRFFFSKTGGRDTELNYF